MRGDLLFYTPRGFVEKLVAWGTHGPFAHVAIDLGDGTLIEALPSGITRTALHTGNSVTFSLPSSTNPLLITKGVRWLLQQVGHEYGWVDILSQVLRFFGDSSVFVYDRDAYDCSELATRYLLLASPTLLGGLSHNPALVSPNDLARQLFGKSLPTK